MVSIFGFGVPQCVRLVSVRKFQIRERGALSADDGRIEREPFLLGAPLNVR